jgi:hypothetical protein
MARDFFSLSMNISISYSYSHFTHGDGYHSHGRLSLTSLLIISSYATALQNFTVYYWLVSALYHYFADDAISILIIYLFSSILLLRYEVLAGHTSRQSPPIAARLAGRYR